ncbi:MAG: hypothetical protein DSY29_03280 [Alphaproteobacteria bacterium]|nr:MAG: hypothetical protein DSY29_03280 [Alphaproteobacteria bacterium]
MDDKLKPNQEKRIIENCVESIMDDLDVYHFDEKLMNKYEKQLIEFFTKISEEHSLFSPGFDFSNKKNIVNDEEKIKKALKEIKELEKYWESEHAISLHANPQVRAIMGDVRQIKKTLEK